MKSISTWIMLSLEFKFNLKLNNKKIIELNNNIDFLDHLRNQLKNLLNKINQ